MRVIYNMFFSYLDKSKGINLLLKVFDNVATKTKKGGITEQNIIAVLNCLMWLFGSEEDATVNAKINDFIMCLITFCKDPT